MKKWFGPLESEYRHKRSVVLYFILREGRVFRPAKEENGVKRTGQCRDHRYNIGIRFYLNVAVNDVVIKAEHSSHPGDWEFKLMLIGPDFQAQELKDLKNGIIEKQTLLALANWLDPESVIRQQILEYYNLLADVNPPKGW